MRKMLKKRIVPLAVAILLFVPSFIRPPITAAMTKTVNVLFIAALEPGDSDLQDILQTFKHELRSQGVRTEVFIEFLDAVRIAADRERMDSFEKTLQSRFVGIKFDIILAQGNLISDFAVRYRDRFFPGIPVYCFDRLLGPEYAIKYKDSPNVYGRMTTSTVPTALRLAESLFPDNTGILLVIPEMSEIHRDSMVKVLNDLQTEFPTSVFQLITTKEFLSAYSLPSSKDQSIVLVLLPGAWRMENGDMISGIDLIDWLLKQYPYPILGTKKSEFGTGLVGGAYLDPVSLGRQAGRVIFDILFSEEKPEAWQESKTETTAVDYRALQRFRIPLSHVPKDALVLFTPPGFWIRFEKQIKICVAILLIIFLAMVIIHFIRSREHRLLVRLNEQLEGMIEKRTEELIITNQELEAANGNLKSSLIRIENMQESLLENERDAVLGRMAVGIAHEINNPLAAVKSSAYSLRELLGRGPESLFSLLYNMNKNQLNLFFKTVNKILVKASPPLGSQDEQDKNKIKNRLREWGIEITSEQAEMAYDAGLAYLERGDIENLNITGDDTVLKALFFANVIDKSAAIIDQASDRISGTVEVVRSYALSQNDENETGISSITDTVNHALSLLHDPLQKGITLRVSMQPGLAEVPIPPFNLVRVWVNLIQNAIQAMKGKGILEIQGYMTGSDVLIDVKDSGPGVNPDIQDRLFMPFPYAEKKGMGMGLGLSICRKIVEMENGSIMYERTDDWTVFSVRLPGLRR